MYVCIDVYMYVCIDIYITNSVGETFISHVSRYLESFKFLTRPNIWQYTTSVI